MPRKSKAAQRRSDAARKGWRTRRARAEKRSVAAKKGWVTRRLNRAKELRRLKKAKKEWALRKAIKKTKKKVRGRSMWAVTVAAPYFIRQKGKKRLHDSPDSAAYMVQGWYRTQKLAQRARASLVKMAIRGRVRAVESNPRAYDPGIAPDVEIKKVPYRAKLLGTIEETDER